MAADEIESLEKELAHASAIAAASIGQPDRAQNVAYRSEIEAKLRAARRTNMEPVAKVIEEYFIGVRKDGYIVDGVDSEELAKLLERLS